MQVSPPPSHAALLAGRDSRQAHGIHVCELQSLLNLLAEKLSYDVQPLRDDLALCAFGRALSIETH